MTPIRNVLSEQHYYYYVLRSDEIEWKSIDNNKKKTPTMKTHKIVLRVSFLTKERRRRRKRSQIYNSRLVEHSQCVFFCVACSLFQAMPSAIAHTH